MRHIGRETVYTTAGESIDLFDYCVVISQDHRDEYEVGKVYKMRNIPRFINNEHLRGFNIFGSVNSNNKLNLQLGGTVNTSSVKSGQKYFISDTPGQMTKNPPSNVMVFDMWKYLIGECKVTGVLRMLDYVLYQNEDITNYITDYDPTKIYFITSYTAGSTRLGKEVTKLTKDSISILNLKLSKVYYTSSSGTGNNSVGYFSNSYSGDTNNYTEHSQVDKITNDNSCYPISAKLTVVSLAGCAFTWKNKSYFVAGGTMYGNSWGTINRTDKIISDDCIKTITAHLATIKVESCASLNYIFGGYDTGYSNRIEKLISDDSYSYVTDVLEIGNADCSSTNIRNKKVFIFGGSMGYGARSRIRKFSLPEETITVETTALLYDGYYMGSGTIGNDIYLVGGSKNGAYPITIEKYNTLNGSMTVDSKVLPTGGPCVVTNGIASVL